DVPFLYDKLTAREFLEFMGALYRVPEDQARARSEKLLRLLELDQAADALIEAYSHGMRQKTALAGALLHDPPVLILDEPTSGLDPPSSPRIQQLLRGHLPHGTLVAHGTLDELRQAAPGARSLEEAFVALTRGGEDRTIEEFLEETVEP